MCSYPKPSGSVFNSWTQFSFVNRTAMWKDYVSRGGSKAVFGEFTLGGAPLGSASGVACSVLLIIVSLLDAVSQPSHASIYTLS